jgi:4-hydroxyacetophenone monooxygenase
VRLNPPALPITDDDDEIRSAVTGATPAPLLAAVAQATGDLSILRDDLRPDPSNMLDPTGGLSVEQVDEIYRLAADALIAFRDRGCARAEVPTGDDLARIVEYVAGGPVAADYVPLLHEELALSGDERAPQWNKSAVAPDTPFTVAIIGAGMSGIVAAHRLHQAGVDFVILEKNNEVGGTWWDNQYPGCRVDIPNHFYSYSFAQTNEWPNYFAPQRVLYDYFRSCAEQFGLVGAIRFGTEVCGGQWDEAAHVWRLQTRSADGTESSIEANAVISAVGQLNRPKLPDIPGVQSFSGAWFHSARWRHDVDLDGKRVAVIGTGASAAQFIPFVADDAAHLTVFQRTPPWVLAVETYREEVPSELRWVLQHLPEFARWDRLYIFWRTHEGLLPMAVVDPEWEPKDVAVSAMNDVVRQLFTALYELVVPDRDLLAKVLPKYPPIAKRIVFDSGIYLETLQRDDVTLCTDDIAEITANGIRTVDGVEHEFDVIIYGTGFEASKFLTPMKLQGVGGVDLHERWSGDARAHLGIVVPEFPNLFLMYGPNTNIVINGSIIYFSECETNYIVESVRMLLAENLHSMECTAEAHDRYNEWIDAGNQKMAWGVSSVNSWYKNDYGRVAQNWPFSLLEYWQQTRTPNRSDYTLR